MSLPQYQRQSFIPITNKVTWTIKSSISLNLSEFMHLSHNGLLCISWVTIQNLHCLLILSYEGQSCCFAKYPGSDSTVIRGKKFYLLHSLNKTGTFL
jgi:hypothetical protein